MVDADGATDINDFENVFKQVQRVEKEGLGCAIGSRNTDEAKVQVRSPFLLKSPSTSSCV